MSNMWGWERRIDWEGVITEGLSSTSNWKGWFRRLGPLCDVRRTDVDGKLLKTKDWFLFSKSRFDSLSRTCTRFVSEGLILISLKKRTGNILLESMIKGVGIDVLGWSKNEDLRWKAKGWSQSMYRSLRYESRWSMVRYRGFVSEESMSVP